MDEIISLYAASEFPLFREISELLKSHKSGILASFTYITVTDRQKKENKLRRLSNGPMEGFNNNPKDYKRNSNGVSNFEFTRSRILWALRENALPLAVPKKIFRFDPSGIYRRGPYRKK